MTKDPVCGMEMQETMALVTAEYKGKTFYFCGRPCVDKFIQAPKQYNGTPRTEESLC